jgi:MoxR-like ATPase
LLASGWALEVQSETGTFEAPTAADLRELSGLCRQVDITSIVEPYTDAIGKIRDLGVALTDRRCVKILKLLAASAVLCGRTSANVSDFWVLRYIWDREEQIAPLASLITGMLEDAPEQSAHPLAAKPEKVDPEELAKQLDSIESSLSSNSASLIELARLREQTQAINDRTAWVPDAISRDHLLKRVRELQERIG